MAVFFSFHYERDVHRVNLVRNMGAIEGQKILNGQDWENIRRGGHSSIQKWIDDQMRWKSAVVVLIGRETANRTWVQYEIKRAWIQRKPILGIRIHGLSSMGTVDIAGPDPFLCLGIGAQHGIPVFDPTTHFSAGGIDTKATYLKLLLNLESWANEGKQRR